jgi:hypothetical protein
VPKLYIIVFHPDRNVRQSLMAAKPVMLGPVVQNNYRATKCNIRFIKASIISDSFYGQQKFTILADNAPLRNGMTLRTLI